MLDQSITSSILSNAHVVEPSDNIKNIVKQFSDSSDILFFEHPRLQKSFYYQSNIFISIRLTFWQNNSELMKTNNPSEVIALRILHELGHIVNKHEESIVIVDGNVNQLISDHKLMRQTQDAWEWAIDTQEAQAELYDKLAEACRQFEENYDYVHRKNW